MRSHTPFARLGALALTGALLLGAAACNDDPVDVDDDHGDPASVRLMLGGQEIVTANPATSAGHIHLHPGEETAHIDVEFLDEDGDVIHFDEEPDFYLEVDVADESIAEFEQDTPGEFGGHAHGLAEGETTFVFKLMHGTLGSGHSDWNSAPIEVEVVDDEHGG